MKSTRHVLAMLLSVHAVAHAFLALAPGLVSAAGGLVLFAGLVGTQFPPTDEPKVGAARLDWSVTTVGGFYAFLAFIAVLMASAGTARDVQFALYILTGCQIAFLALPRLGHGYVPILANSQLLCCLTALVGGPFTVTSVIGVVVLVVVFLAVDHRVRRRAPSGPGVRRALGLSFLLGVGLLGVFLIAPPRPHPSLSLEAFGTAGLPSDEVIESYAKIALLAALGIGAILFVRWLLKDDEEEDAGRVELPRPRERSMRRRAPSGGVLVPVDATGDRGKLIRRYLRFLNQAARKGAEREPAWTPAEHARRLPAAARRLAELFVRARYSREHVSPDDVRQADEAARDVLARLGS